MSLIRSLDESSIPIAWAMSLPSISPKSWQTWGPEPISRAHVALEKKLAWPEGTISILERAFDKHLGRGQGWQLDALADREPYIQAASIFRRGVATSSQRQETLSGAYTVYFRGGKEPPTLADAQGPIIIDQSVAKAWNIPLRPQDLSLALDETNKSLETVATIKGWIASQPGEVSIVGGGILADVAAFSAALIRRPFRLIPTTLLAMLDACIGGKTGVNFARYGKNQLGLFAFPTEVLVATSWLKTLPEREFKAGLSEAYKHALIKGDRALAESVANLPHTSGAIEPHLADLVAVKAAIIREDPNETGKRAVLNFGHTLAHALEKISHHHNAANPILHGEAIGIGMLFALFVSNQLRYLDDSTYTDITGQLKASHFLISDAAFQETVGFKNIPKEQLLDELLESIMQDKKNQGSQSSAWILMKGWGRFAQTGSAYTIDIPHSQTRSLLKRFFAL